MVDMADMEVTVDIMDKAAKRGTTGVVTTIVPATKKDPPVPHKKLPQNTNIR